MKAQVGEQMSYPWVRMNTDIVSNPKLIRLREQGKWRAVAVFLTSICFTGGHKTDGFLDRAGLRFIGGTPSVAADLVKAGLWDVHLDGWRLHDFAQYQPTSVTSDHARRAAQARWGTTDTDS